ncbi:MAG TPA: hypothetical protein VGX78_19175 [Pirellulales bacterium]|nr:hypothetical protein [Pirellulales bacterium]
MTLLSHAEAWQRLPAAKHGSGGALPAWARALAGSLPRTTAAMLELDWRQRAASPLDRTLRGKLRLAVARANRCDYTAACALADLELAAIDDAELTGLDGDEGESDAMRAALAFARKLTLAGSTVSDEEVAQLMKLYGDRQVVAIVLLVAYANFQDRLVLALGLEVEGGGPLPPLDVRFSKAPRDQRAAAPSRIPPAEEPSEAQAAQVADAAWLSADFAGLQDKLEAQRCRPSRIRVPAWEEVREALPPGPARETPFGIRWSLVCLGYQPELAGAWSACLRTFADESKQDRVFEESLFWVITRSIDCFY